MQGTFGKTIESRIIPSLSKTISRCADDAFKEWKQKIDRSINDMLRSAVHAQINSSASNGETTVEQKKVGSFSFVITCPKHSKSFKLR